MLTDLTNNWFRKKIKIQSRNIQICTHSPPPFIHFPRSLRNKPDHMFSKPVFHFCNKPKPSFKKFIKKCNLSKVVSKTKSRSALKLWLVYVQGLHQVLHNGSNLLIRNREQFFKRDLSIISCTIADNSVMRLSHVTSKFHNEVSCWFLNWTVKSCFVYFFIHLETRLTPLMANATLFTEFY